MENNNVTSELITSNEVDALAIIRVTKIVGLYSICEEKLKALNSIDTEVLLDSQRLYFVVETNFLGNNQYFAIPFRTNIPKNHPPYKALPKMSGAGNTGKGKTHGLHFAKTIPVEKSDLVKSRHAKAYKPLLKEGKFSEALKDLDAWIVKFEGEKIDIDFTPYKYSVKLKKLLNLKK